MNPVRRNHAYFPYAAVTSTRRTWGNESMPDRRVAVFGPAYLDRVLRVDRPLIDPRSAPPSIRALTVCASSGKSFGLDLIDPSGYTIAIEPPDDWPGPTGDPLGPSDPSRA